MLEIDEFLEAVRRVGTGGTAIDPEVVAQLMGRRRDGDPLEELSPREREVLALMAEGLSQPRRSAPPVPEPEDGRDARAEHLREARCRRQRTTTARAGGARVSGELAKGREPETPQGSRGAPAACLRYETLAQMA